MRYQEGSTNEHIRLLNMPIRKVDEAGCVDAIMHCLSNEEGGWVITSNIDILQRYVRDQNFRQLAARSSMTVADGMPLIWASIVQGNRLPQRVAGSNLITSLCTACARDGRSVFLLGGDPGTAVAAADVLQRRCPGLPVAGTFFPEFGFERDAAQLQAMRVALESAQPDVVFVALGSPKQEVLIGQLRDAFPATWWIGVGISFSFLAGRVSRAPRWMQQSGLEWLHRLCQDPQRLAKRYLVVGIPFTLYLLFDAARVRVKKTLLPIGDVRAVD